MICNLSTITREDGAAILRGSPDGTFLVRVSAREPGSLVIMFVANPGEVSTHADIHGAAPSLGGKAGAMPPPHSRMTGTLEEAPAALTSSAGSSRCVCRTCNRVPLCRWRVQVLNVRIKSDTKGKFLAEVRSTKIRAALRPLILNIDELKYLFPDTPKREALSSRA